MRQASSPAEGNGSTARGDNPAAIYSAPAINIDPARVRCLFERKLNVANDFILREISQRMHQRLDYINLQPQTILDAGCGLGADLSILAKHYPSAQIIGLDIARARVQHARGNQQGLWRAGLLNLFKRRQSPWLITADYSALPLQSESVDLLWSNLALHWHGAPHVVFPEWRRVLKNDGLVLFSAFGPDTLCEVRDAFTRADLHLRHDAHVLPFTDLHDYGDMLVAAGLSTPVMDMEKITLTYRDTATLWRDVRTLGGHAGGNPLSTRGRGLMSRASKRRLDAALDTTRDAQGNYRLTIEVLYGHAWRTPTEMKPPTHPASEAVIQFHRSQISHQRSS